MERVEVPTEEIARVAEVPTVKLVEKTVLVDGREIKGQSEDPALPRAVKEIEDDWFVLFEASPRVLLYVPPGMTAFSSCKFLLSLFQLVMYILFLLMLSYNR